MSYYTEAELEQDKQKELDRFLHIVTPKINPIVTNQKFLRQKSEPINENDDIDSIVKKLKRANDTAWINGCGLAGIQIGIAKRIAWLNVEGEEMILVNPVIHKQQNYSVQKEGCLSIPENNIDVRRADRIFFSTETIPNQVIEATGFKARVIQHEIDHMDGILNIDKEYKFLNIGRNESCPCGSGKKYKKCCL